MEKGTKEEKEFTTIKVSKDTVIKLNELKIHPRQSYEEVILDLIQQKRGDFNGGKRKPG